MLSSLEKASPKRRMGRGSVRCVERRDLEQSCMGGSGRAKNKGWLRYEKKDWVRLYLDYSKSGPRTSNVVPPESSLEMWNLRSQPGPPDSEFWGVGSRNQCVCVCVCVCV